MSLVIRRNSWHYRLHLFVRKMWGCDPSPIDRWSLCPYFQTTFWGTIAMVLAVIPAGLGWLFCRLLRKMYKVGANGGILGWFAVFCDNYPPHDTLGQALDKAPESFKIRPIIAGITWFLVPIILLAIFAVIGFAITMFAFVGWKVIPLIPEAIWTSLLYAGYALFESAGFIWFLILAIGSTISFVFFEIVHAANVSFWAIVEFLSSSSTWLFVWRFVWKATAAIGSLAAVGVLFFWISSLQITENFYSWIEMKANGYAEARKRREKIHQDKLQKDFEKEMKDRSRKSENYDYVFNMSEEDFMPGYFERKMNYIIDFVSIPFKILKNVLAAIGCWIKNLYAREVYVDGMPRLDLGPIGVLVKFLAGIKQGACPLLEFVNAEDLKTTAPTPPMPKKNDGINTDQNPS